MSTFSRPVRIRFHHVRKRLADIDGLSVKAVIDGLVASGVLRDDTPQQVAEISHSQSKTGPNEEEKTIVTITRIST